MRRCPKSYNSDEVWFGLVWFCLCCLMTPGLSKDVRCHVWKSLMAKWLEQGSQ